MWRNLLDCVAPRKNRKLDSLLYFSEGNFKWRR